MRSCDRLRPALLRSVEAESSPAETLRLATHLDGCTACRIVAARARRLALALESLGDTVVLDDETFLRRVMDALPSTPPPGPRSAVARRRRAWILRKRVSTAAIAAAMVAGGAAAAGALRLQMIAEAGSVPRIAESPETASDVSTTVVTLLGVALEGLRFGGRFVPPALDLGAAATAGLVIAGFLAAGAGGAAVAAAWRGRLLRF